MRHQHPAIILCGCLLLAACGSDKTATTQPSPADESLPMPMRRRVLSPACRTPGHRPCRHLQPTTWPPTTRILRCRVQDGSDADPDLPVEPSNVPVQGPTGKPIQDAMPVMPIHPPDAGDQTQATTPPPPPET